MAVTRRWRWWVLAGLLHAAILFSASMVLIEQSTTDVAEAITVTIGSPAVIAEARKESFERKGIPTDEAEVVEGSIFSPMGVGGGGGGPGRYGTLSGGNQNESADADAMRGDSKDYSSYVGGEAGGYGGRRAVTSSGPYGKKGGGSGKVYVPGKNENFETLVIERATDLETRARQEGRGGELKTRVGSTLVPIPLKHTDVKAQVSIYLASVTVKQQYHNPYDSKIEAVYVFPLPDDAAVRDFVMIIGDRTIRGMIREKEEAKKIYEEERSRGHVASLMTQERDNVFTQSVANIEPGKQIDIDITYFHALKYAKGEYEFHFPMVVGPRYNPSTRPPSADSLRASPTSQGDGIGAAPRGAPGISGQRKEVSYLAPGEITSNDITLEVDIDAGLPIDKIESPSHILRVDRAAPSRAKVKLAPSDRIPNKDFVLRYKVGGKGIASAVAAHRDAKGGYFTLVLTPPDALEDIPASSREMFFVLDVSGSMSGAPIEISKRTMERCLRRLAPGDTFQIVTFAGSASSMAPRPLPATPENIKNAMAYVESQSGDGGTEMLTGIRAALDAPRDPDRRRIVSFMTDGYIGNEVEIFAAVKRSIGDARIFSFGIGSSVNRYLIEGLGRIGRGTTAFVGLDESSEKAVDALYQRIEHPALTDLRLEWKGGEITDVYPSTLPDLFVGKPVVITGRFKGAGESTLRIVGKIAGKEHVSTMMLDMNEPGARHAALPAVWARSRIASLADRMLFQEEGGEDIRAVAIEYGLISQYTAFVAVDSSRVTEGAVGTTVPVPVPVPAGVKYDTTVPEKK